MLPPSWRMYFPIDLPRPVPPPVMIMVLPFSAPGCSIPSVYFIAKGFFVGSEISKQIPKKYLFFEHLSPFADEPNRSRSEEHTSELQSREKIVFRLLLEKKRSSRTS